MRRNRLSVVATAVVIGLGLSSAARAAVITVTLTDGDKGGTTSFTGTSNHWGISSDSTLPAGSAPTSGYNYIVTGTTALKSLLRTPTSGSTTFGGSSLQINDGADLLIKSTGTTTANLVMNGGVVEVDGTGNATLAGTITFNPSTTSYLNADNGQGLAVTSTISGNGALVVNGADSLFVSNTTALFTASPSVYRADNPPAGNPAPINGNVTLSHANNYAGGTTVALGKLLATVDGAFGTGNVTTNAGGSLTESGGATNNYISNTATLSLSSASGGLDTLNYTGTDYVAGLVINGVSQPSGVYGAVGSSAANQYAVFSGTGTITVVPEPTSLAMAGLLAAGLLGRRRRMA